MDDEYTEQDTAERDRPGRGRLLLGGTLATVLLAAVGGTVGWVLADPGTPETGSTPAAAGPGPASPSEAPTTARPTTARATTTPPPAATSGGLTVPRLVGLDFEKARDELHDRKLGWRLVFGAGSGRTVTRTVPAQDTSVRPGTTVRVEVSGPAPEVEVPDLVGEDCADAADELGDVGLFPRYPTGNRGEVVAQVPAADATAHWNDQVAISCGGGSTPTSGVTPTP
ncbi:PASTA domain-containing protein [Micromonospora matsumotoense]|uniref:PASTA domain-containing protein n=1 Tax=Micromonospora matsumotoense TaxID=121616 RepID=A0A1C5AT78_9ACTN|nr:PASTA domain-containing protein [Micromonospora matsumotoense]SCF48281.1 PASTA domain-containing protein [Micromonospora matsumotoense]